MRTAEPEVAVVVNVGLGAAEMKRMLELAQEWGVPVHEAIRRCTRLVGRLPELAVAYERAKVPRPKLVGQSSNKRQEAQLAARHDAACTIAEVVTYEFAMAHGPTTTPPPAAPARHPVARPN